MFKHVTLTLCVTVGCAVASGSAFSAGYTETRYPIVFAHGMFGFDNIGAINYWYGIPAALQRDGAAVYVTQVSAVNSSEERGEQLLAQVEEILAITGAKKVNLIGHSHGGQSIRYVAGMIPDKVASVTTVGSPAKGSSMADIAVKLTDIPILGNALTPVISGVVNGLGKLIGLAAGENLPQDFLQSLNSLTTKGTNDFNQQFPAGVPATECGEGSYYENGIYNFSWSGSSAGVTNFFDISSYAMALLTVAFKEPNDGLVGKCSSHFGQVLRDNYRMDHLDEVNQLLGLVGMQGSNPKAIYRQHANRLQNLGL